MEPVDKAKASPAKERSNVVKVLNWGDSPPLIVCICGSTKFKSDMLSASRAFTLQGHIVVMPGVFGHVDGGFVDGATKQKLDDLHFRKIEMADIVYVVNRDGYVGSSTKKEIDYALSLGKLVRFLES